MLLFPSPSPARVLSFENYSCSFHRFYIDFWFIYTTNIGSPQTFSRVSSLYRHIISNLLSKRLICRMCSVGSCRILLLFSSLSKCINDMQMMIRRHFCFVNLFVIDSRFHFWTLSHTMWCRVSKDNIETISRSLSLSQTPKIEQKSMNKYILIQLFQPTKRPDQTTFLIIRPDWEWTTEQNVWFYFFSRQNWNFRLFITHTTNNPARPDSIQ